MDALTSDAVFNGKIQVKQHKNGYRFSIDAVLLADHIRPKPGDRVVDLGTGCGIIPLILAYRHPDIRLCGVEIQETLADIARLNVRENRMADQIVICREDIKALDTAVVGGPADLVVSNPPYRKIDTGRLNPDPQRAIARHEIRATLLDVLAAARRLLRKSGRFVSIYPAERTVDLLAQMRAAGIEPKAMRMIHSSADSAAKLILVEGIKGGGCGLKIGPPLILYAEGGDYMPEVARMLRP